MKTLPQRPILVVSVKWQTRALLAAQLGEMSDHDVVSARDVTEALGLIKIVGIDPALLVVDAGRAIGRQDVKRLVAAQPQTPLVLTVSAFRRADFAALRERCAAYLVRPVTIGRIAQAAVRLLSGEASR